MIRTLLLTAALAFAAGAGAIAQTIPAQYYNAMQWRMIGPFRGGRTVAVSGVPSQRGIYYMAATDGGIWKSTDYGRTWDPIFDGQDTGSIGALAVAPSDPNILYAGSGEGLRRPDLSVGDGIYKSTDAGATWTHLGLRDGMQIGAIAIDPRNPDRVFAAVLGHPYGPNEERGLYRSTDGGASWEKVLGKDDQDTGSETVLIDPHDPNIVYAALWASRNPPWRLRDILQLFANGGLYKSTDGGTTWTQLHGGLPLNIGRVGLAMAPGDSQRLYAWVNDDKGCGIYRSSDAGQNWTEVNSESRVCSRGDDFSGIAVDPSDRDVVYATNTQTYRSTDAGKTWTGLKGAPGGDDYHSVWIDPGDRNVILLGSDQGATLSVNYGRTWSSWYNQPTAQFYHVITDDRFPYRVFGGQQESGSAEVLSRSDDGAIWIRYWHPVGASEYGYVAPDPLHPTIIYGAGGGTVSRYDETLQQTQDVSPDYGRKYRYNRTNPLVFSRADNRTLYFGSNVVFATTDGGRHWRIISPDLTRANPGVPANLGHFAQTPLAKGAHRGVVYSLAPSYIDRNLLWAGTDDGLIWLTRDGGNHWKNVSPPTLAAPAGSWSKISQIDSSHFDRGTAYVAVTRLRLNDMYPYIYATHDFGAHWTEIHNGLPDNAPVDTVREDPKQRHLLFAGTENTAYFSVDDGANWQSLQLNLPSTSIRDLVVHGDDLVAGTHGRSFWILDDISPLRSAAQAMQSAAAGRPYLFAPGAAIRVRRDTWTDTPLPPEEPAAKNPPDGAILDYYLPVSAHTVEVAVYDAAGNLVRKWSSTGPTDPAVPESALRVPAYWVRPPLVLSAGAGPHRIAWDYRYTAPPSDSYDFPISAIVHDTPVVPEGALALPGTYTVALTVDGVTQRRTVLIRMDPRVTVSNAALRAQFALAMRISKLMADSYAQMKQAEAGKDTAAAARYSADNGQLGSLLDVVESADAAPTPQTIDAVAAAERALHGPRG